MVSIGSMHSGEDAGNENSIPLLIKVICEAARHRVATLLNHSVGFREGLADFDQ